MLECLLNRFLLLSRFKKFPTWLSTDLINKIKLENKIHRKAGKSLLNTKTSEPVSTIRKEKNFQNILPILILLFFFWISKNPKINGQEYLKKLNAGIKLLRELLR